MISTGSIYAGYLTVNNASATTLDLDWLPVLALEDLQHLLGMDEPTHAIRKIQPKHLEQWKMEVGDQPIFRYIYRNTHPSRHLEFGTWEGEGLCYCLQECDAIAWTINLLEGESRSNGDWAYATPDPDKDAPREWTEKRVCGDDSEKVIWHRTDAYGFIGHRYRSAGFGHRVNQIYCDSTQWDCSHYPSDFFDSVLIDGGHQEATVISDTRKALSVTRPGAIIMWHDVCPELAFHAGNNVLDGVASALHTLRQELEDQLAWFYWIKPSYIMLGQKKSANIS